MSDTPHVTPEPDEPDHGWTVRVSPESCWGKTYGLFPDRDAAVAWCRANGWHPSECAIHVVHAVPAQERADV